MSLFFGLGNPGVRFAGTRHNVGYDVLAIVAHRMGLCLKKPLFDRYEAAGADLVLARPLTYMNRAGEVLPRLLKRARLENGFAPQEFVVVCDTLDLPLGRIRVRQGGGTAGHNGIRSIIDFLGHSEFARIYIGIGRPAEGTDKKAVRGYVLEPFAPEERHLADDVLALAADALFDFTTLPTDQIMSRYNGRDLADNARSSR